MYSIIQDMGKHDKTLLAIFTDPVLANIKWRDVESLVKHLGATIKQGRGSRVHITLNGVRATFHRPHPSPATKKSTVQAVREFLTDARISP